MSGLKLVPRIPKWPSLTKAIEPVFLAGPRQAVGLDLEAVAGPQRPELAGIEVRSLHEGTELVEEMLEAPRRDDLQDPARLVAGVPEGVPLVARLERQVAHL